MDDEQILQRGGDEDDIARYARRNGADLTEEDVCGHRMDDFVTNERGEIICGKCNT